MVAEAVLHAEIGDRGGQIRHVGLHGPAVTAFGLRLHDGFGYFDNRFGVRFCGYLNDRRFGFRLRFGHYGSLFRLLFGCRRGSVADDQHAGTAQGRKDLGNHPMPRLPSVNGADSSLATILVCNGGDDLQNTLLVGKIVCT